MRALVQRLFCRLSLVAVGLLVFSSAVSGQSNADQAFRLGLDARDKNPKGWATVASEMQKAIAVDPNESERRVRSRGIGGLNPFGGDEYLPYFYLGEALSQLDQCGPALTAWEQSDRQDVARKDPKRATTIDEGYKSCEGKGFLPPASFAKELQETGEVIAKASDDGQKIQEFANQHPEARVDLVAAKAKLEEAKKKFDGGRQSRLKKDLEEARTLALGAQQQFATSRRLIDGAAAKVADFNRRLRDLDGVIREAEGLLNEVKSIVAQSPVKVTPPDSFSADLGRAEGSIIAAREKFRTAGQTQLDADLAEGTTVARAGSNLLTGLRTQARTLVSDAVGLELEVVRVRGQARLVGLKARALEVESTVKRTDSSPVLASEFMRLMTTLGKVQGDFERSIGGRDIAGARKVTTFADEISRKFDDLAARLGLAPVPQAPPNALSRAADAFFAGRYQDVISVLSAADAISLDAPFRVHGHAFRAAALFALYEYSGRSNQSLLGEAQAEVSAARAADGAFRPDASVFSPRFSKFYSGAMPLVAPAH